VIRPHPDAIRHLVATRYVSAFRTSSSLPILVEADDDGLYVLKLRGAGQGTQALVAELVAGTIGRLIGLPVPEMVLMHFDPAIGTVERDAELRDLFAASAGLGLGLDYLPGAVPFDPLRHPPPSPELAARIVLFDLYVMNVDRQLRPSNLLVWHEQLYLIDHGAALSFQYNWPAAGAARPDALGARVEQHVLWPFAGDLREAAIHLAALDRGVLASILAAVPDAWLAGEPTFASPAEHRAAYVEFLAGRAARAGELASAALLQEH
jgi:hypothetical protein